ncbi:hypothetical protein [Faecalibacillus intestinalis]|uniref:hypothetical protein n=1 Tax=Faecalibacillus intestinalis TaxID=1982626 RepID=UPI003990B469
MKKKCKVPCDKLHRMDRDIKRILWRIQMAKYDDLTINPSRNHIYILGNRRYSYLGITMLETTTAHPYEIFKEQPLDRERNCRSSMAHIGIIKSKKILGDYYG